MNNELIGKDVKEETLACFKVQHSDEVTERNENPVRIADI
jgi:hypothetical protein